MGINISRLNAEVVKQLFSGNAYEKIITDPRYRKVIAFKHIYPGGED